MRLIFLLLLSILVPDLGLLAVRAAPCWGRLANPGFDGARIKTTFFFAGQASDGSTPYGCFQVNNLHTYTLNPVPRDNHLNWVDPANRHFVLNLMVDAGINLVTMSSWGEDFLGCSNGWVTGAAPMQTSPEAHTNLFEASVGKPLLIMPLIETRFNNWAMRDEFPRWITGEVAPGLVSQIVNLIQRYLQNGTHPEWANKWARVYDRNGTPRYAVAVIHAGSNRIGADDHAGFAEGFDLVAAEVAARTGGIQVGFFIDALPPDFSNADFKPSATGTGPFLRTRASFLGIQCFIPEVFTSLTDNAGLLAWKRNFLHGWFTAGVPVLVDVSPGYNGDIVFQNQPHHAPYGYTDTWIQGLTALVNDYGHAGMVYNSWNGFTEGMAAMPVAETYGSKFFDWLRALSPYYTIHVDRNFVGTELGTASQPFNTVAEAYQIACDADHIQIRAGNYPEVLTLSKRLTVLASGGPVIIGR